MTRLNNIHTSPQRRRFLIGAASVGIGLAASAIAIAQTSSQEQVIKVVASKFTYAPNRIMLKRGVPVALEFTTLDVPMGFNAPDFKVRTDILPGKASQVRFTPDKVGEFTFHCDLFCGSGHEDMTGVIVVT
ncbi:cupredoxin domain-containing protein [Glaciimonas sp. PCH181]|uniref:cupredoxin domain-containing protein n=1 Tax=Glaciimonas sp. PCH181 TaxID=2133943 RepID=UPI000D3404B4|nr:cupredoxin domain-containing protein [Glaciimonas sp. PCH181]PUA19930.1 cytochrome-c oxidase [Glaciimonas sp. PCH181]